MTRRADGRARVTEPIVPTLRQQFKKALLERVERLLAHAARDRLLNSSGTGAPRSVRTTP